MSASLRSPGTMMTGIGNEPAYLRHHADQRAGTFGARIGGQHQHRDIDVLVDHVEELLGRIALADHPLRRDRGDAVGAAGGAVERVIGGLLGLGAHDVGDPQPLLVLVLDLDDAQHHHPAADADRPAAGVIDRAVPFRGVVNDNKAFWLVTRLVASSLGGHACPGAAPNRRMVPRRSRLRQAASQATSRRRDCRSLGIRMASTSSAYRLRRVAVRPIRADDTRGRTSPLGFEMRHSETRLLAQLRGELAGGVRHAYSLIMRFAGMKPTMSLAFMVSAAIARVGAVDQDGIDMAGIGDQPLHLARRSARVSSRRVPPARS